MSGDITKLGIIDDSNYRLLLPDKTGFTHPAASGGERRLCGTLPKQAGRRLMSARSFESLGVPMIPRSEWDDRARQMERTKTRLSDIYKRNKLPVQDQDGFGWCHAYSAVNAVMLARALQNLPYVRLSEASVAGPVTGWKNRGAWIMDDLESIATIGVSAWDDVPEFCTNPNRCKPGWEARAKDNLVTEFVELPDRNMDAVMSCLFARIPVCVGLNWWGHAITYHDPCEGGVIRFLNSWGERYEDGGWGMLRGGKAVADEAYAVVSAKWSE